MTEIACIVCPHILANERFVRALVHHGDGTWQATCGERDHAHDCNDFEVVGLNHLIERQPDLLAITNIQPNYVAELSQDGWSIEWFDEDGPD